MTALDDDWINRRYYDDLPEAASRALHRAGAAFSRDDEARAELAEAGRLAPGHLAVMIGWYKFYFYKGRLAEAVPHALDCVRWGARAMNLPGEWQTVSPGMAGFGGEDALPRFYLYALKAYGYCLLRTGRMEEGCAALAKVAELDPADTVGAVHLLAVARRGPDPEDEV